MAARIEGQNITFTVRLDVATKTANQWVDLVTGDVVLDEIISPVNVGRDGYKLKYDPEGKAYAIGFAAAGTHHVDLRLVARPRQTENGDWREATFEMPSSRVRDLEVVCDQADVEVELLGAVRVKREVTEAGLRITGVQGADRTFAVRWKPQVQDLDAELVFSSESNTIATLKSGTLRLDTLIAYDIAQGRLDTLSLRVPKSLSITQVRGANIRDWRLEPAQKDAQGKEQDHRTLVVVLNRPQTKSYGLQVVGESPLGEFPAKVATPVVQPVGGIRAGGHIAVGTDSAIAMVVEQAGGLSQIDADAFSRLMLDREHPRPLPAGKAFFYSFASPAYALQLAIDHVVPSYDATQRIVVRVGQDELRLYVQAELEVRDAPLRQVGLRLPKGMTVVNVTGAQVEDYRVTPGDGAADAGEAWVTFTQPLLGRGVIDMELELGRTPLDETLQLSGVDVLGARSQRGFLVVAAEEGVDLGRLEVGSDTLREVNTASVPLSVGGAQLAYRFRDTGWIAAFTPKRKPVSVRVEAFHLISLGEGVAYGNVALSYFITGSPIDELRFRIDPGLRQVEFVGRDVRGARQDPADPSRWTVKLQRRVIGDYNLGVTYAQRYSQAEETSPSGGGGNTILLGGVRCEEVESQTGYLGIASHLNITLDAKIAAGSPLTPIDREELPANYRLLVGAPLLASYQYMTPPSASPVAVNAYDRGELLDAVVELTQMHTEIVPGRGGGATESSTTVTFKVKNSSSQFLALQLPDGAQPWSTHLIEAVADDASPPQRTRINAAHDAKTNELLIPLRRPRDPNAPMTIELVYGQVHDKLGFGGGLSLAAPSGSVASTFDRWTVRVPRDWAVHVDHATATPDPREEHHGRLSRVLGSIGMSWAQGLEGLMREGIVLGVAGAAVLILLVVLLAARRAAVDVLIGVVLVAAVFFGIAAANTAVFRGQLRTPDDLTSLQFTRVMSSRDGQPVTMSLRVVPAWRQYATVFSAIVVPAIGLGLLIASIALRKWRPVLVAAGLTALLYGVSHVPALSAPIGHLLTWGVPALLLIVYLWRVGIRRLIRRVPPQLAPAAAAVLLAVGFFHLTGCATGELTIDQTTPVLQRVELDLSAEADAMSGEMRLTIDANEPMRFALLPSDAVVLSVSPESDAMRLEQGECGYELVIKQAGRYTPTIRFLRPLAAANEDQVRAFSTPMPQALTNRVTLSIPGVGYDVHSASAMRLTRAEEQGVTRAQAILAQGEPARFAWRPRARQRELEPTSFYATTIGVARFDAGMIEQDTAVRLEVAQGQVDEVKLRVPAGVSVTAVDGPDIGAWRFDPATRLIEAKLARPATSAYAMRIITQRSITDLPATAALTRIEVLGAERQRATLGLVHTPAVYLTVGKHPQAINTDDFARDAAALLQPMSQHIVPGVRFAYRAERDEAVEVTAHAVTPELRSVENASFTITDERLVYNGALGLSILKAGRFSVDLEVPAGYDVDALAAPQVSHWDERTEADGRRVITVHFPNKTLGEVELKIALSRPIAELPAKLDAPRIEAIGTLKHSGQMVVTSEQGVRLSVADRVGVSELDPAELGVRVPGALAARLLRPGWALTLNTEVIDPVVDVAFLHAATVAEGLIRHRHDLRYTVRHAGVKTFELQLPSGASGVVISGAEVARINPVEGQAGLYRVELARKVLGLPHQLSVRYETRYDRDAGEAALEPVLAVGADRQRGFVAVMADPRVELAAAGASAELQLSEARTIPRAFGAGDLSGASLCYRASGADYQLDLSITRHGSADLLAASVRSATIDSVVTEAGASINRVRLELSVGGKRHLETRLPDGAQVWSLLVGARSTTPSIRQDAGRPVYLIPLRPDAAGELPVQIDLVYAVPGGRGSAWDTPTFHGPRFDLPLHNLTWTIYAPEGYAYMGFGGTLSFDERGTELAPIAYFTAGAYEQEVERQNITNLAKALDLQERGNAYAALGNQRAARQALESAFYYSQSDAALNEDARVQLHRLAEEQALVGLVGSRGRLRQQAGLLPSGEGGEGGRAGEAAQAMGEDFDREQAKRLRNSLSKADSENLDAIIARMIEMQDAAAAAGVPLMVNLPVRGKALRFERSIQVEPDTPMVVTFDAATPVQRRLDSNLAWSVAVFVVLLMLLAVVPVMGRMYAAVRRGMNSNGSSGTGLAANERE